MKTTSKLTIALAAGAILSAGLLNQSTHASTIETGTAELADVLGASTGPEALLVNYTVSEVGSIFTYSYVIQNPSGDVELPGSASPGSPETVSSFGVFFNASSPLAFINGTQTGGTSQQNNGALGLFWTFNAVSPGSSSSTLSFESLEGPTLGAANASGGANPPAPWSSLPYGQLVAVPGAPDIASTGSLLAGVLTLVPLSRRLQKRRSNS